MQTPQDTANDAIQYPKNGHFLPVDTNQALHVLVRLSERLHTIAERQTQCLVQNDTIAFAILVQEQEVLCADYAAACEEFKSRLHEFRKGEPALLNKLERLQKQISEKSKSNNKVVERIYHRSRDKTNASLINVQELAAQKPLRFDDTDAANGTQTSSESATTQ